MAASATRRDLYLQVGGNVDGLTAATKAGRTALIGLGQGATDVVAEVNRAFNEINGGNLEASLKTIDANITKTISGIGRNLRAAASAPDGATAANILNLGAAQQAAAAAEAEAAELRTLAAAAETVANKLGDAGLAQRALAVGFAANAAARGEEAKRLRDQADALETVATEAKITARAEDEVSGGHVRMGTTGMMAEHVVRAFSDSIAAGQSPARAFTMEIGRISEMMTMFAMQTEASDTMVGRFAGFMGGPWGLAISLGTAILVPLISHLFETDDAAKKALEGLKEFEQKELDLPNLIDKTTGKLKDQIGVLSNLATVAKAVIPGRIADATQEARQAQSTGFAAARDKLREEGSTRAGPRDVDLSRAITNADGSLKKLFENLNAIAPSRPDLAPVIRQVADAYGQELVAIQKTRDLQGQQFGLDIASRGMAILTPDSVSRAADAALATTAAEKAALRVRDAQASVTKIGAETVSPAQQAQMRAAEAELIAAKQALKTAQDDAKSDRGSGGGASAALLRSAEQYRGLSENKPGDRKSLMDLFSKAGMNVDPKMVAWCAAFVNAVLATNGLKGTGSLSAQSFLNFGTNTNSPQRGDIVVAKRQGGGHVGFFEGYDKAGNVKVLGGNTADKVGVETIQRSDVLGYRRAPTTAAEQDTQAQALADKVTKADNAFADMKSRAQEEYLQLLRAQVTDIGQAGELDRDRIEEERKRVNAVAQARADEAKSYDSSAQARADEIIALNDASAELKKQASIRKEITDALARDLAAAQAGLSSQITLLQLKGGLLTSSKDRRANALDTLTAQEQQQRDIANNLMWSPNAADIERGKQMSADIDAQHPFKVEAINRQTADPMEQWTTGLKESVGSAGALKDTLESIEVHGIDGMEDEFAGSVTQALKLKGAVGEMAQALIKLAEQKILLMIFGGFSTGHVPGFATGHVPGFATGKLPGFASGVVDGVIRGPGTGTSDSILAYMAGLGSVYVSDGEGIMTAKAVRKYGRSLKAMNDDTFPGFATGMIPADQIYYRDLPSAQAIGSKSSEPTVIYVAVDKSELFDTHVQRAAAPLAQAAVLGGSQLAQQEISSQQLQRIPT